MDDQNIIEVLLIEDNRDFANLVELFLKKHDTQRFHVTWQENGSAALAALATSKAPDVILMDYFLPGQNGLEVTRAIQEMGVSAPVVFLTVNKDFDLAVEVMKLGVEDYLVKEEVSTPVLPKTILNVIERRRLRAQLTALEITQKRLEAIQEMVMKITQEIRLPLDHMRSGVDALIVNHDNDQLKTYLGIIRENLLRIDKKITQLKEMKTDKTVPYIRDIRMLDLSD
jgi:sigma-B regulation protein RsbU (phosphoserine phosphatase)